jgi:glycerol uptake facilitator-like aquaporin
VNLEKMYTLLLLLVVVVVVAAVLVTIVITVALHFQHMQDIFLFSNMSGQAVCPAQPLTQCATGGFSPGTKAAWA